MKLYHVTRKENLQSILDHGIDPLRSKGKLNSVWGVVKSRVAWAIVHVLSKKRNKDTTINDYIVIEYSIPKKDIRRYKTGIWFTREHVQSIPVTKTMVLSPREFGKC